jgi:hypothetical protein
LKRYDEPLDVSEAVIATGERSLPRPRTTVAEVLFGRPALEGRR